jgi:hypothetical protein
MPYNELSKAVEALSYRDKLRLAQLLIQLARKEEEEQYPQQRAPAALGLGSASELLSYVAERIKKLRPSRKEALLNSLNAMFQFQGGISEQDRDKVVAELQKKGHITIDGNNHVAYPEQAQG